MLRPEHAQATPFSWPAFFLAPASILWDYLEEWSDTNGLAAASICLQLLISQLLHWHVLLAAARDLLRGRPHLAAQALILYYVVTPVAALLLAGVLYALVPLLPWWGEAFALYGLLVFGPMVAALPILLSDRPVGPRLKQW